MRSRWCHAAPRGREDGVEGVWEVAIMWAPVVRVVCAMWRMRPEEASVMSHTGGGMDVGFVDGIVMV